MEHRDWLEIRKSVINAMTVFGLSLAALGVTVHFNQQAKAALRKNTRMLADIEYQARKARDDLEIIARFKHSFDRYTQRGYIGPERRLSWVSVLQESAKQAGIPSLQYRIDAQGAYTGSPLVSVDSGNVHLRESIMHFSAQLLHEGEFIYLFENLRKKSDGLYEIRLCDLDRAATEIKYDPKIPNIVLECKLSWVTVQTGPEELAQW